MIQINRKRLISWKFNPDKHYLRGVYSQVEWWVIKFEDRYCHWAIVRFNDKMGETKFDDRLFITREIDHLKASVENYLHDEFNGYER